MKKSVLLSCTFFVMLAAAAQKPVRGAKPPVMKNLLDSFSYAAGYNVATNMKQQDIDKMNIAVYKQAIEDVFNNKPSLLTQEQISMSLQFQLAEFRKGKLKKEKDKGAAYMAENKNKKGVISLPNGLQYEVLKAASPNAPSPKIEDTAIVHYIGTHVDGKEFDNSVAKGTPYKTALNRVIKGWTEILQLMKIGDKWKVVIPSDLAYGDEGRGGQFAGSTLVFEMELMGVVPFAPKQ
jgi:FKBP-type peptidyl-prolyl cis-trans isomerase FklB